MPLVGVLSHESTEKDGISGLILVGGRGRKEGHKNLILSVPGLLPRQILSERQQGGSGGRRHLLPGLRSSLGYPCASVEASVQIISAGVRGLFSPPSPRDPKSGFQPRVSPWWSDSATASLALGPIKARCGRRLPFALLVTVNRACS